MKNHKIMVAATVVLGLLSGVGLFAGFAEAEAVLPTAKLISRQIPTIQTTDGQSVDIGVFTILDDSVMHTQARVMAIELSTGKAKAFNLQASFKRVMGVLSIVGSKVETEFETGDPQTGQWDATIGFDDVTDKLFITVTGVNSSTIDWMGDFEMNLYQP